MAVYFVPPLQLYNPSDEFFTLLVRALTISKHEFIRMTGVHPCFTNSSFKKPCLCWNRIYLVFPFYPYYFWGVFVSLFFFSFFPFFFPFFLFFLSIFLPFSFFLFSLIFSFFFFSFFPFSLFPLFLSFLAFLSFFCLFYCIWVAGVRMYAVPVVSSTMTWHCLAYHTVLQCNGVCVVVLWPQSLSRMTNQHGRVMCVLFTLNRFFSTRRHVAHPVSALILHLREIQALWSHKYDTDRQLRCTR